MTHSHTFTGVKLTQEFKATQNCVACCNKEGLLKFLEGQQSALEVGTIGLILRC